jgi:hypothetical protein
MAEIWTNSCTLYDENGNIVGQLGDSVCTFSELSPKDNSPNDYVKAFDQDKYHLDLKLKQTKINRWRLLKIMYDYKTLGWYYKFRIWLGFWLKIR